jgi:hypothetical protein
MQKRMQEVDVSAEQLGLFVRLLTELGVAKGDLQATVLKAYKARFGKLLAAQMQLEEKRLKQAAEEGPGEGGYAAFVEAGVARLDKTFVREFREAVEVYRQVFFESNGELRLGFGARMVACCLCIGGRCCIASLEVGLHGEVDALKQTSTDPSPDAYDTTLDDDPQARAV